MSNMGRPPIEIDKKLFQTAIQIPMTKEAMASLLGCGKTTLDRYIEREYGCTFSELQEENRGRMKMNIVGKQYELAMKGDRVMLIWLGKQYCGQSDNPAHDDDDKET